MLLVLLACASAPPDPRPALLANWTGLRRVKLDAERAFRDANYGEACAALKLSLAAADPPPPNWPLLLTVASRDPSCLTLAEGDSLAAWGHDRPEWRDAVGEWEAAHGLYVDPATLSPGARLGVLMRGEESAPVVAAAAEVLADDPTDARACRILVQDDVDRGELLGALARCPDVHTPALLQLRASALDEAGRWSEAVAVYDAAGFSLHSAAVLYQEGSGRDEDIEHRLDEPVPPAALHRALWDILRGRPPRVSGLDESPEAQLVRALAGDPASVANLPDLPGLEPRVLHARLTGNVEALDALLAADPDNEVLWRARLGVAHERGLDAHDALARLRERDGDHLRLRGSTPRREAPWRVLVPSTWSALAAQFPGLAALGEDDVGRSWRAAQKLSEAQRSAALAELQAGHPELRGLARVRAGGSILDGPPAGR